jgi:hypothetical protein
MTVKPQVSAVRRDMLSNAGMHTPQLRGVSALRLSVLTDETTSPERQREANRGAAASLGIDLADREAVDLGVSASKTTPFERPSWDLGFAAQMTLTHWSSGDSIAPSGPWTTCTSWRSGRASTAK